MTAGVILIALHAAKQKFTYLLKGKGNKEAVACDERARTLFVWQHLAHLFKDVRPWLNRKLGEVYY